MHHTVSDYFHCGMRAVSRGALTKHEQRYAATATPITNPVTRTHATCMHC